MARNRSNSADDRDEDYSHEDADPGAQAPEDYDDAPPRKKRSGGLPWALLAIVLILAGAGGYFAATIIGDLKSTAITIAKQRDDALAKVGGLEAGTAGLEAAKKTLEDKAKTLEAELADAKAKLAQGDSGASEDAALVASAKGSSKGKLLPAKAGKKTSHKKSRH